MRKSNAIVLLGAILASPGCYFARNIHRNISHEIRYVHDLHSVKKRARKLGEQAWTAMVAQYGECFSEDYEDGFVDGFVDYLVWGGCISSSGESPRVPATPPERYTHSYYMNPQGYRAIEEWYMGFRHGSATAQASGLRNLVVVPVFSAPVFPATEAEIANQTALRQRQADDAAAPPNPGGTLPAPRPLPESGAAPTPPAPAAGQPPAGVPPAGPPGAVPPGADPRVPRIP